MTTTPVQKRAKKRKPGDPPRLCHCGRPAKGRGMCTSHYQLWWVEEQKNHQPPPEDDER